MSSESLRNDVVASVQSKNLPSLQVLRFVAAFSVVLFHLGSGMAVEFSSSTNVFDFGTLGVDIFFVLSGFIISYTANPQRGIGYFAIRRFARVVPLYWLLTLAVIAIATIKPSLLNSTTVTMEAVIKSMLFIPYEKSSGAVQPLLFLGWTLCYEMFFYVIYAFCLLWKNKADMLCVGAFLAILAAHFISPQGSVLWRFYTNPIVFEFALGILLCKAFIHWEAFRRCSKLASIGLIVLALIIYPPLNAYMGQFNVTAPGLFAVMVVAGFLFWKAPQPGVQNIVLSSLVLFGNASYGLYLMHPYLIQASIKLLGKSVSLQMFSVLMAITALATVAVSVAVFAFIEKPIQSIILNLAKKIKTLTPEPAPFV
ncbi:acyltransferase [Rhizobium sp.]|uniref:acyltransferase family protein n=1 Tax=Rhizobium sp. TaxID=391 RepID=UPI002AA7A919